MISIHASAREATHPVSSKLLFHLISIHASAREATRYGIIKWMEFYISIHASAREATIRSIYDLCCFVHFNPRLREGGDITDFLTSSHLSRFQSTPPRGRRHDIKSANDYMDAISIHASAREATQLPSKLITA